jgi:hypothetical protein
MKRRTVTIGQMMGALVPMTLVLWFARPAVRILIAGTSSHSHPPAAPARVVLPPGACPYGLMVLSSRGHVVHPDPFWPQYLRLLVGRPWPGDYICPLVPPGTVEERPAWRGEMVSADMY